MVCCYSMLGFKVGQCFIELRSVALACLAMVCCYSMLGLEQLGYGLLGYGLLGYGLLL